MSASLVPRGCLRQCRYSTRLFSTSSLKMEDNTSSTRRARTTPIATDLGGISIVPQHRRKQNGNRPQISSRHPVQPQEFKEGTFSRQLAEGRADSDSSESHVPAKVEQVELPNDHTGETVDDVEIPLRRDQQQQDQQQPRPERLGRKPRGPNESQPRRQAPAAQEGDSARFKSRLPSAAAQKQTATARNRRRRRASQEETEESWADMKNAEELENSFEKMEQARAERDSPEKTEERRQEMLRKLAVVRILAERRRTEAVAVESVVANAKDTKKVASPKTEQVEVAKAAPKKRFVPGLVDRETPLDGINRVLEEVPPIERVMDLKTAMSITGPRGLAILLQPKEPLETFTVLGGSVNAMERLGHQIRKIRGLYDAHFTPKDWEHARAQKASPVSVTDYASIVLHKNCPVSVKQKTKAIEVISSLSGNVKIATRSSEVPK